MGKTDPDAGRPAGVPWDSPAGRPVAALWDTVRSSLLRPLDFFARVAELEDRWVAVGYALVLDVVGHVAAAAWSALFDGGLDGLALLTVVVSPLRVLVALWLGSELMHGVLGLLRGASRSRAVTHRAVAYCYGTAVLGLAGVWGLRAGLAAAAVYQVIALRQAHRAPTWKALVAVVVTWALLLGLLLLAAGAGGVPEDGGG